MVKVLDMGISPAKSKAIWFEPNWKVYTPIIRIDGAPVTFEASIKYLGIWLDEKLNFQRHIKELLVAVEKRPEYSQDVRGE